ncbi:MAG: Rap1a/Tai family immunity protein [Stellaceae bacterium]
MITAAAVALAMVATSPPAMAETNAASWINGVCAGSSFSEGHAGLCVGYIGGIADVLAITEAGKVCEPEGTDRIQPIMRAALLYLVSHPEEIDQPAPIVLANALRTAFPCPSVAQ